MKKKKRLQKRSISMGIELEAYSISIPDCRISRELHFPKRGAIEAGERFTKDASIGNEYNSKVFYTIREAFFLLKNGLRKYIHYRESDRAGEVHTIFPVGGWIDRFAGAHIHLAFGKQRFRYEQAKQLARCIHDHIPFLIALAANSPVWREQITAINSNRLLRGTRKYCQITKMDFLYKHRFRELTFNQGGKRKPPTLEIRVLDSGVPEYIVAALCVLRAIALHWLKRKPMFHHSTYANYLKSRERAIRLGPEAKLVWNNHRLKVSEYVDLFFRKYEEELREMDIPDDVINVFKYLKKGWNQATVIRKAATKSWSWHRQTWQRRFGKKYALATQKLLDGNSYSEFARTLGVRLPNIERAWLGRKEARW